MSGHGSVVAPAGAGVLDPVAVADGLVVVELLVTAADVDGLDSHPVGAGGFVRGLGRNALVDGEVEPLPVGDPALEDAVPEEPVPEGEPVPDEEPVLLDDEPGEALVVGLAVALVVGDEAAVVGTAVLDAGSELGVVVVAVLGVRTSVTVRRTVYFVPSTVTVQSESRG
ncbi:hypothetical protein [Jatrophihabitans fulvus]